MALITDAIGVHTVLGAFTAGILVGQSPILTKHIDEQLRGLIVALFMPVFFGLAGQHTDLGVLANTSMLALSVGMILIASLGKFAGAFLGGKLGGMTGRESLALACGMNARGSTEVIVATLGLSMGVLNEGLFTSIVAMAVVTTMAMPPMLRWALGRVPLRPAEEARLEREAVEARGFVSNFERLLVAVDRNPSGRMASRLAGLLAGTRRLPTTVLPIDETMEKRLPRRGLLAALTGAGKPAAPREAEALAERVKAAGEQVEAVEAEEDAPPLDVVTRLYQAPLEQAIAEEATKGYDLLMIGYEPPREPGQSELESGVSAQLSDRVARIVDEFDGPFAIVAARGPHRDDPDRGERDILVPVTGTEFSRRGAEVALTLARANNARITALHVSGRNIERSWRSQIGTGLLGGTGAETLREIVRLGEQQGVAVRPLLRRHGGPEETILRQVLTGGHDLVVMGVSRRPGKALTFGGAASAVIAQDKVSVLLVSS
jgi:nucleotide-binding universal stress UspA family protein